MLDFSRFINVITSQEQKLAASKPLVASSLVFIFEKGTKNHKLHRLVFFRPRDILMPNLLLPLFPFFFLNVAVMTNELLLCHIRLNQTLTFGDNNITAYSGRAWKGFVFLANELVSLSFSDKERVGRSQKYSTPMHVERVITAGI